jgi:hypothetical protein
MQMTSKNVAAQIKELVKSKDTQSDLIAKLLETKTDASDIEKKLSDALSNLKVSGSDNSGSGLSEADKNFLKELTNETKDAIQDMRLEVLTASDKSKHE